MRDSGEARLVDDDLLAITAHVRADATSGHRFLAQQIWHTAQALGVPPGGQVLATGQGSALFVGTTPHGHDPAASVWAGPVPWRAAIPPRWPYPAFTVDPAPEPAGTKARGPFTVQVISQVGLDVHLRSQTAWSHQQRHFHEQLTQALDGAAPGGLVFALANHSILDNSLRTPWDRACQVADFLGAARLPSHALRTDARCDAPFDLMIFRRRPHGATEPEPGLVVPDVMWMPDATLSVNTYYRPHRDHVLGLPIARTDRWDLDQLTVLDIEQTWQSRLPQVLDQIARTNALHTSPGTAVGIDASPTSRPAPRSITPAREHGRLQQATHLSVPPL
jgi:hypothetical protein